MSNTTSELLNALDGLMGDISPDDAVPHVAAIRLAGDDRGIHVEIYPSGCVRMEFIELGRPGLLANVDALEKLTPAHREYIRVWLGRYVEESPTKVFKRWEEAMMAKKDKEEQPQ